VEGLLGELIAQDVSGARVESEAFAKNDDFVAAGILCADNAVIENPLDNHKNLWANTESSTPSLE